MNQLLNRLLRLRIAFALCILATASTAQINELGAIYGTTSANGVLTCAQRYSTYAALKTARPVFAGLLEYYGIQGEWANKTSFEADLQSYLWNKEQGGTGVNYADGCGQRNLLRIDVPGVFKLTMPLEPKVAQFEFFGTAAYAGTGYVTGGTCLAVDHANWSSKWAAQRTIFLCNGWGQPANVPGAFAEGLSIRNVMLDGGKSMQPNDPSYESYGIAIRSAGSACVIRDVVCNGFNTAGFAWAGGIPIFCENTRSFYNGLYGYLLKGTALSTGMLIGCETDDCGRAMFGFEDGYGQACGGNITIYSSKAENGKNGATPRPMTLCYTRGSSYAGAVQFVGFKSALYNSITVPTAFDIRGTSNNFTVTVTGFNECGSNGKFTSMLTTASSVYGMTKTTGDTCRPISFSTNGTTMTCSSLTLAGTKQADAICQLVSVASIGGDCPPCPDPVPCPDCPACNSCCAPCPTLDCALCPAPTKVCGDWVKTGLCTSGQQKWKQTCSTITSGVLSTKTSYKYLPCP